ncbi:MAG: hypothetical protein IJA14_04325 [Alphaproteobacteria bacterium]|nr:hypothetical protein [Alphaproteobacteria bacterium]
MALMKKSELAQKLGVSRAYISKLIKEGKLKEKGKLVDDESLNRYKSLKDQLLEAKLHNEELKGELLREQVKEIESKYISKNEAIEVFEERTNTVRNAVLKIPDRVADAIALMTDIRAINQLLRDEIRATLFRISEGAKE